MTSDIKKFGKRIQSLRMQANLSQEELSEKMKISREYLSLVERGKRYLSLKKVFELACILNIRLTEVFNFEQSCLKKTDKTRN